MNVCLVFPRTTVFEDPMVMPPLGLFWIWAVLEQHGHQVTYIDMSEYRIIDGVKIPRYPDVDSLPLVGFDAYLVSGTSPQAREIRKIVKYLHTNGQIVIAGGPHVSNYAGEPFQGIPLTSQMLVDNELVSHAHVLVKYEGERAVIDALSRLDEGKRSLDRFRRGIVIQSSNIDDLGTIPIPNRSAAHLYRYYLEDERGRKHQGTTMFTSRGCPEECRFCDSPGLWGRKVRYTPINRVIEELDQIKSLGFDAIQFYDDILPLNRKRMEQICQELKRRGFYWRCFFRVDIISKYGKDFLQMMYDHGCREALVGVESGSQEILDNIHKHTTVEQNTLVRQWCREVGVRFKASVILGLPGERADTMEATRQWILDNRPDRVNVCIFVPFTGTPIAKSTEPARRRLYGQELEYDIAWDMDAAMLEEQFYAGGWNTLKAGVRTSHLSADDIERFYHQLMPELASLGIGY